MVWLAQRLWFLIRLQDTPQQQPPGDFEKTRFVTHKSLWITQTHHRATQQDRGERRRANLGSAFTGVTDAVSRVSWVHSL